LQCRQKCHVFSQTIHGNANICIGVLFNRATELPSESFCFDCLKVVATKNPYWPCAGLKVNFRKESQEAAIEANKNLLLSSREAYEFKDCLYRVERLEE